MTSLIINILRRSTTALLCCSLCYTVCETNWQDMSTTLITDLQSSVCCTYCLIFQASALLPIYFNSYPDILIILVISILIFLSKYPPCNSMGSLHSYKEYISLSTMMTCLFNLQDIVVCKVVYGKTVVVYSTVISKWIFPFFFVT